MGVKNMTFKDLFRRWGLNSIKLNAGFAEIEFGATEDDQTAAWDMYVELITRITIQPLDDADGDEETALDSVYQLFPITREILKSKGRNAENFSKIAIIVLNQIIRPFTAKWHNKKLNGAFLNKNECVLFRMELKQLQEELICYSKLLAEVANVEDLACFLEDSEN